MKSFMFYEGYNIDFKTSTANIGGVWGVISLLGSVDFSSEDALWPNTNILKYKYISNLHNKVFILKSAL